MPVVVTCRCGQSFRAIDELAGKQVNCPSCAQPLTIPPLRPASSAIADDPLDLGDVSGFEQSAALAPDPLGGAGVGPSQATNPAFSGRLPQQAEGMDRSVVLALWIGGGVVVLLMLAMVLTSLLGGSGDTPAGQSVAEAEPDEAPAVPAESKPEAKNAEPKAVEPKPAAARSDTGTSEKAQKSPRKQPAKTRPQSQPSKPSGLSIKLSAGTALAQTLPTGTAMGFSVDYRFTSGQPDPAADYMWVIQTGDGGKVAKPMRLESRGTLQDFVQQLRPENGPFRTHIEDQRGTRLSESLPMRR